MVIYTYAPRVQYTMKYTYDENNTNKTNKTKTQTQTQTKTQTQTNKKKNKGKNRSKEVDGWDDIPGYGAPKVQKQEEKQYGKWVQGTIPMKTIKQMKWGDIDELTDEEFGYYEDVPANISES